MSLGRRWHAMSRLGEADRFTAQAASPVLSRLSAILQAVAREARRGEGDQWRAG
ncbi:hypothetical protein [Neoroseomonas lacus]|nr:hypothetical protein [Neoroseomonas lacus]